MTQGHINHQGWIKLHRKLLKNVIAGKPYYFCLWVILLLKATHRHTEFIWNGRKQTLKPGQLITSRIKLSDETGISESTIERILKYLENEQQIGQQKSNKFRIITIRKWTFYQGSENEEQQNGQQADNKRTHTRMNKNEKEEKKSPLHQVFTHWNSYKGRTIRKRNKENQEIFVAWRSYKLRVDHSLPPEAEKAITEALEAGHSVQDVCGAIDNYAKVLLDADYWWTYVWPLSTFLMVKYERRKDAEHKFWQFLPDNFVEGNYLTEAAKRKRADSAKGPKPYELVKQQAENQRTKNEHKQIA